MTPREEIVATGMIGEQGARLLYRSVTLIAIGRRFPPPEGFDRWSPDAVRNTAHDFLVGSRGKRRLMALAISAETDEVFEQRLEKAVVNFLRDRGRKTDMGKLIRRVSRVLSEEPLFDRIDGQPTRWSIGGVQTPNSKPAEELARSMDGIEVTVPKWSSENRDKPLADRPSFIRLMEAVLAAASGSMSSAQIAQVLAYRLDHHRVPLIADLDVQEVQPEGHLKAEGPESQTLNFLHAEDLFNSLSDRERIIVATFDTVNVRELGELLDVGKSQAALLRQRLISRFEREFADGQDAEATLGILRELCEEWISNRTS